MPPVLAALGVSSSSKVCYHVLAGGKESGGWGWVDGIREKRGEGMHKGPLGHRAAAGGEPLSSSKLWNAAES